MDVSIIYLNYNSAQLTLDCIKSFYAVYGKQYNYEIIVLDNASSKEDVELLKSGLVKGEIFVETGGNLGTSKAWNIGAKQARGKYLFYVNSDMLFINDSVGILKTYMDEHDECGACGGNLYNSKKKPTHSHMRYFDASFIKSISSIWQKCIKKASERIRSLEFNYTDKPLEVDYVCGADMLIRKAAFEKVGGFDENIFMYAEEADLQYQMRKGGYKIVSVPSARMVHFEGDTFEKEDDGFSAPKLIGIMKGMIYYFKKNYSSKDAENYVKTVMRGYKTNKRIYRLLRKDDSRATFADKAIKCIDNNFADYLK